MRRAQGLARRRDSSGTSMEATGSCSGLVCGHEIVRCTQGCTLVDVCCRVLDACVRVVWGGARGVVMSHGKYAKAARITQHMLSMTLGLDTIAR